MPIYDQTFRRYDGVRSTRRLWWPVVVQTFRPVLKNKLTWLMLLGVLVMFVLYSVGLYAGSKIADMTGQGPEARQIVRSARQENIPMFDKNTGTGTLLYVFNVPLFYLMAMLMLAAGGGSISQDLKNNALPLYFSRPLAPAQYLWGKVLGLAILPAAAFALAVFLLYVQHAAYFTGAAGFLENSLKLGASFVYIALTSIFMALAMASFSSITKTTRTAVMLYIGFLFLTGALAAIFSETQSMPALRALAPRIALQTIGRAMLQPQTGMIGRNDEAEGVSVAVALAAVVGYGLVFAVLLRRNLKVVEVVK